VSISLGGTGPGNRGSWSFGTSAGLTGLIGSCETPRSSERTIVAPPMYSAAGGCEPSGAFGGTFGSSTSGV
jgi:hypothetical protein